MCKVNRNKSDLLGDDTIVYKYKSVNENSVINGLLTNSLYMSTLDKMNDPLESGFYVNGDYDANKIRDFQQWWLEKFFCISLSMSDDSRKLWNYYTDGMKGMVLGYTISSIREALGKMDLCPISYCRMVPLEEKPEESYYISEGKVVYDGKKIDLSNWYRGFIGEGKDSECEPPEMFFHKDKSWEEEKEYRFIIDCSYIKNNIIENIIPASICVGYRINQTYLEIIKRYCRDKGISLFQCQPDFNSCSSKKLIKMPIVE